MNTAIPTSSARVVRLPLMTAEQEAEHAAGLHEARIRLWVELLRLPASVSVVRGERGLVEEPSIVAAIAIVVQDGHAYGDPSDDAQSIVAGWLADVDRGLERAAAILEGSDPAQAGAAREMWDDVQARRRAFAAANHRLVGSMVRRYVGRGIDRDDLVQEGTIGLLKAVDRFDHRLGFRFATYATWWVRNAMAQLVCGGRLIRIPAQMRWARSRLSRLQNDAERRGDAAPTGEELAARGLSPRKVRRLESLPTNVLSIDAARDKFGYGEDLAPLQGSPDELPDRSIERIEVLRAVASAMDVLSSRQASVLQRRFGLAEGPPETLQEIADSLGLSRERVRQIENEALALLRKALARIDPELAVAEVVTRRRHVANA